MNLSSKTLKELTKGLLKKNMGLLIGGSSIYVLANMMLIYLNQYLISIAVSYQTLIINILITFILSLLLDILHVGYLRFLLLAIKKQKASFSDLVFGFKTCPDKIIGTSFLSTLVSAIWIIPSFVFLALYYVTFCKYELYVVLFILFLMIGGCITCYFRIRFSQCLYVIAEQPAVSIKGALHTSGILMHGQMGRFLYLYISFLGMFLIGLFTYYIGFFVIMPYYFLTMTFFYMDITKQISYKQKEE